MNELVERVRALVEDYHDGSVPGRHVEVNQQRCLDAIVSLVRADDARRLRGRADSIKYSDCSSTVAYALREAAVLLERQDG